MKKTLIAIVFAAASIPMMFAQTTTPADGNATHKTAVKKHSKKGAKKAPKTSTTKQ